ncbi:MAG: hypothetical protein R6V35_00275 [Candidatus Nanohaloarchaea archaeon]
MKALREDGYSDDLIFSAVKKAEKDLESGNRRSSRSNNSADSSQQEMSGNQSSRRQNNRNQDTRPQNNETEKRNNNQRHSNNSKEIVPGADLSDNQYTLKQRRYRHFENFRRKDTLCWSLGELHTSQV